MTKFHPDRHHASTSSTSLSSEKEQEVRSHMATMATDVTRAYSILEDPLSRSLHLLELGGEAISESDRVRTRRSIFISSSLTQLSHILLVIASTQNQSIVNNHLLVTIMTVREEVDSASTDSELRPILQSCREQQDEICEKLSVAYSKGRMKDAKYLTAELQYWKRVEETIIEKMHSVE